MATEWINIDFCEGAVYEDSDVIESASLKKVPPSNSREPKSRTLPTFPPLRQSTQRIVEFRLYLRFKGLHWNWLYEASREEPFLSPV